MPKINFKTNPESLEALLGSCGAGTVQLPDFQRSWVWEEDRIRSLLTSVSRGFPIGALMTLATRPRGEDGIFAWRLIQGVPREANDVMPAQLLLDGQQRMTSLYQACMRKEVVETITPKKKLVRRWFYVDLLAALNGNDREEAIVAVPEDRRIKTNFDRQILRDLSSRELEYEHLMFPLNQVFDWDEWQDGFGDYWIAKGDIGKRDLFKLFKNEVLQNFKSYQVPVICLDHDTSTEAVCLVFEKVNTGGKALDAFELLTAMYAAKGHKLRDDWLGADGAIGLHGRLTTAGRASDQEVGVLAKIASTDFLQAIALLHSKAVRAEKVAAGVRESELPAVRATRQSLLDLPLEAYLRYREPVEDGFKKVVKFLRQQCIHRPIDLPYQTQLVPLAAIFAELGDTAEHTANQARIARWFWCGICGELYSSAVESRFAKDIVEIPEWLRGGPEPSTVKEGVFRADRLWTLRSRLSAAYKGIHALLMRKGAKDFRTGQGYDLTVFFEEAVDIHHIFPEAWCKAAGIDVKVYDTVINKTPLSFRTNRILGGGAPSAYLTRLEKGGVSSHGDDPPIPRDVLDEYLESHCVPAQHLRSDDFHAFMAERRGRLLGLIANVTEHSILDDDTSPDEGEELGDRLARDVEADSLIELAGER